MLGESVAGRYVVERLLGEGGMGEVYEARDRRTGTCVALKLMLKRRTNDRDLVARFERETAILRSIRSEHIAQVFDAGVDAKTERPYIVMELLSGLDVDAIVTRSGRLSPDVALRIAAQACAGLEAAHAAGVIHRDVKASNLFVSASDGEARVVKLLDFGVAKTSLFESSPGGQALTATGDLVGSPLYMSPEQVADPRRIDHRTDIWSVGVVLYEMLAGCAPHASCETTLKLLKAITEAPIPPLHDAAPWVQPEVAAVVHRALRASPAERFPSAREMREAVLRLLGPGDAGTIDAGMIPLPVRPPSAPRSDLDVTLAQDTTTVVATRAPVHRAQVARTIVAVAAGLAMAGALVGVVALRRSDATRSAPAPAACAATGTLARIAPAAVDVSLASVPTGGATTSSATTGDAGPPSSIGAAPPPRRAPPRHAGPASTRVGTTTSF